MRILILLFLLGVASGASGQATFTLVPPVAGDDQVVRLRWDSPLGCYSIDPAEVARTDDVVVVTFLWSDEAPCLPEWQTPRFVSLGVFAVGTYEVRVIECGLAPPPLPSCQPQAALPLTVVPANPITIPALSAVGVAAVALLMLLAVNVRR